MKTENQIVYMDAILRPNASLSPRGFAIIMSVIGSISFLVGLSFISMGALPIAGFMGLDALAVWLAFRHSFRQQREETRVLITGDQLSLSHTSPNRESKYVQFPPAFVRVELDEHANGNTSLRVEHGQRAFIIGRFLTISERKSLANAMRRALRQAREERYQTI